MPLPEAGILHMYNHTNGKLNIEGVSCAISLIVDSDFCISFNERLRQPFQFKKGSTIWKTRVKDFQKLIDRFISDGGNQKGSQSSWQSPRKKKEKKRGRFPQDESACQINSNEKKICILIGFDFRVINRFFAGSRNMAVTYVPCRCSINFFQNTPPYVLNRACSSR